MAGRGRAIADPVFDDRQDAVRFEAVGSALEPLDIGLDEKAEHFSDSDMFTADHPAAVTPLTTGGLHQWGPPVPSDFEAPKLTPDFLWKAFGNVRRSDEMTFGRGSACGRPSAASCGLGSARVTDDLAGRGARAPQWLSRGLPKRSMIR